MIRIDDYDVILSRVTLLENYENELGHYVFKFYVDGASYSISEYDYSRLSDELYKLHNND